jgi:hypothetical protein
LGFGAALLDLLAPAGGLGTLLQPIAVAAAPNPSRPKLRSNPRR